MRYWKQAMGNGCSHHHVGLQWGRHTPLSEPDKGRLLYSSSSQTTRVVPWAPQGAVETSQGSHRILTKKPRHGQWPNRSTEPPIEKVWEPLQHSHATHNAGIHSVKLRCMQIITVKYIHNLIGRKQELVS